MSSGTSALLLLIATVAGVDADRIRIDAGLIDGLRDGDGGTVYYELAVGETTKRVDVGSARVVEIDESSSELELESERPVQPGYRVRFELPSERTRPAELVRLARERLDSRPFDAVARRMLDALVPPDKEVEERFIELLEQRRREREDPSKPAVEPPAQEVAAPPPPPPPALPMRVILPIPAGSYLIGLPPAEAKFFNQQPRFEVELRGFLIDRDPVSQRAFRRFRPDHAFANADPAAPATGLDFEQAVSYCRSENARLPTEFEWQAAVEQGGLATDGELLEWTASWYKAYPGNRVAEETYGERFRVLRSAASASDPDRHLRRYLDPTAANQRVGFRCVLPDEAPGA